MSRRINAVRSLLAEYRSDSGLHFVPDESGRFTVVFDATGGFVRVMPVISGGDGSEDDDESDDDDSDDDDNDDDDSTDDAADGDDDEELGEAGKKALAKERKARKSAEKRAKAAERRQRDLEQRLRKIENKSKPDDDDDSPGDPDKAAAEAEERERERYHRRLLKVELKALAVGKLKDPDDIRLIDVDALDAEFDEDDELDKAGIEELKSAIDDLLEEKPHLAAEAKDSKKPKGDGDGGPRGGGSGPKKGPKAEKRLERIKAATGIS